MRTEIFHYDLPNELIAQQPLPRGESRLLVLEKATGAIHHRQFADLRGWLHPSDLLVRNNTRVTAHRLFAATETGAKIELISIGQNRGGWHVIVRPAKRCPIGKRIRLDDSGSMAWAKVTAITDDGGRIVMPEDDYAQHILECTGETPLPPYIHSRLSDPERYQTVYATEGGSAAAPTAGLHFTGELLDGIEAMGVTITDITLNIGVGTFRPVKTDSIGKHHMHSESANIPIPSAQAINARPGRLVSVGTTCVRALETAADDQGTVQPGTINTDLFITPGYRFKVVDALLTNFHLPCSTLLMLVCAFAGIEPVLNAYQEAIRLRYRFFSFGDAMLII